MRERKKIWPRRVLVIALSIIMLIMAFVPAALATGRNPELAGRSVRKEDVKDSTMPQDEIARMGQRDDVMEYAPLKGQEIMSRTAGTLSSGYEFDPDLPFIQEELNIPTFAYIPCTDGYVVKINLDTEKVVASYRGSADSKGGPRRVAYDEDQNAWVGNLRQTSGNILAIKSDISSYAPGTTSITENPLDALAFAAEKATQDFDLPGANGTGDMVDVRCIAFDANGHLWVGPSNGNFIREYEVVPVGEGENQTFQLEIRRTVVIPGYSGAYVVAFNQKGDLYISQIGNQQVWVVNLEDHDEKYPVEAIAPADRFAGDPRMQNLAKPLITPGKNNSIYAVAADLYTGDVWASGYEDGGKVYRITPDQNVTTFETSVSTAALGRNRRTGIEFDEKYIYINGHDSKLTIRLDRQYTNDPQTAVKNADVWDLNGVVNEPHGLFPYNGKLFLVCPGDNKVAVLNTNGVPANASGAPIVRKGTVNSITMAGTPYVYGAFGTKKNPPGAYVRGKNFLSADGEVSWGAPQSNRDGVKYEIRRIGKASWHTEENQLLYYAKTNAEGNMMFWQPDRAESSATSSAYLEQGNYTIKEVEPKADEYVIVAGVDEGGHKDDRTQYNTLKFSVKDKGNIRLDFMSAKPSIDVFYMPPQPIPQNYPLPVRVTVVSPTGTPSQIVVKRVGETDLVYDVVKDSARNLAYVDMKETDINFADGTKVIATVPDPNGGTMEIEVETKMERIDMLNPIITVPADGSEMNENSIKIVDAEATNRYAKTEINSSSVKFTLTPKGGGSDIIITGKDWATAYPDIPAGIYDIEVYAEDKATYIIAPNSATAKVKDAVIDNGTESPQIDIDIDYDIMTWTNGEVTGTATIHSTLPLEKAEINGQTYVNIVPAGTPGQYTVNNIKFQTNTGSVGSEDYSLKALTAKGSYADNTSKVTWVDKLNPVVDGPASGAAISSGITNASFAITDPNATNDFGKSEVNTSKTKFALIAPSGARAEGADIAALIANALARPSAGNYMIRVIAEDVATNPGTNGANGSIKPGPSGEDEVEFGPFPGEGGTPSPGGELNVTFSGGENVLKNLKAGGTGGILNITVARTLRNQPVIVTLSPASGTLTASNVLATGISRISYSGVPAGEYTMTITIGGDSWSGPVSFK